MTPVTSVPTTASNPDSAPASLAALIGQTMTARILSVINDTTARLLLPGGSTLDIETAAPLTAGATATLSVAGTAARPRFTLAAPANTNSVTASSSPSIAANDSISSAISLVRDLATRQNGLPALFADLQTFAEPNDPSIPKAVTTAIGNMLALRLDLEAGAALDANDIQTALLQAGLENASFSPQQARGAATTGGALTALRQTLQNWLAAETEPMESASTDTPQSAASRDNVPPPPYRGAPTMAQAPVAASLTTGAPLRERALQLIGQIDAVSARRALLQIASLPPERTAAEQARQQQPTAVLIEIPLTTREGTASAQIRISRDAGRQNDPASGPAWHIDFSTTFEPLGPVHTHIALAGKRTTVTMNPERGQSAALLSSNLSLLDAGLRSAELEPGAIRCQSAPTRAASASPGTFLDRAT